MSKMWTTTNTNNVINSTYGNVNGNSTITIAAQGGSLNTIGSTSGMSNIALQKTTYHVLGEDIEVNGWHDINLVMTISTLNVLKKPYYDELVKNSYTFPKEIEDFLKIKFRDILIDEVLKW